MYNSLKKFLQNLNPELIIQAPSRINLLNPLDAVEGDFWMPSVAINGIENPLSVFVYIKKIIGKSSVIFYKIIKKNEHFEFQIEAKEEIKKDFTILKKSFNGEFKLVYASIYRLYKTISCFKEKFFNSEIEIGVITTIPKQSGLGGSAAIIIALIYGLTKYYNLYNNLDCLKEKEVPINRDIIAEIATKVEDKDLKITAGYADRYIISRGGLCFCSYNGKLLHKKISKEPLAIYDRIDKTYKIDNLPMIICFSGVSHDSGDVHKILRRLYLKKEPSIINNYKLLAEISWKARFALMAHDWKLLGKYFKENTKLLNQIMNIAGFKYGIGLANNILIEIIEEHSDVYAAKLTGAGGGGSVFALVNPNKIEIVLHDWQKKLNEIILDENVFKLTFPSYPLEIRKELKNAQFFQIKIDYKGVKLLKK